MGLRHLRVIAREKYTLIIEEIITAVFLLGVRLIKNILATYKILWREGYNL